jgi:hypothetical protein
MLSPSTLDNNTIASMTNDTRNIMSENYHLPLLLLPKLVEAHIDESS